MISRVSASFILLSLSKSLYCLSYKTTAFPFGCSSLHSCTAVDEGVSSVDGLQGVSAAVAATDASGDVSLEKG